MMNSGGQEPVLMEKKPKTKIVCTLGPASRSVPMIEKLLRAGLNVAGFNFSHGSHEYHQETLDNLKAAMVNTGILCAACLTPRGGSTARLVAKYRPGMPILSVVVPEIKTDSFDWSCSDEAPARHNLIFSGLVPALYAGSARASNEETTEEALDFSIQHAKEKGLCKNGDYVVALHRVGTASVIKIITVK